MLPSEYIKTHKLAILSINCLNLIDKLILDSRIANGKCPKCAYILGTVKHETANTYAPIKEYGQGKGHTYGNFDPKTSQAYYGRGYIQLTWKGNYERFGQLLKIDLVNKPDLALDQNIAYNIMILGVNNGLFTGKKLDDYLKPPKKDYVGARRIINGTDKASLIAGYAQSFEDLLNKVIPNVK